MRLMLQLQSGTGCDSSFTDDLAHQRSIDEADMLKVFIVSFCVAHEVLITEPTIRSMIEPQADQLKDESVLSVSMICSCWFVCFQLAPPNKSITVVIQTLRAAMTQS